MKENGTYEQGDICPRCRKGKIWFEGGKETLEARDEA